MIISKDACIQIFIANPDVSASGPVSNRPPRKSFIW